MLYMYKNRKESQTIKNWHTLADNQEACDDCVNNNVIQYMF